MIMLSYISWLVDKIDIRDTIYAKLSTIAKLLLISKRRQTMC
jgi:hypothetical protein